MAFIPEVSYGVTPGVGDFETARFTSEALSGTPETVESQQIRTDRMGSGQIVVGLTVGGDMQFELAKEVQLEQFLESAMYSSWNTIAAVTEDMDIDATAKTLTRGTGDFTAENLVVGDFLTLSGYTNPLNNVQVMITNLTALVITFVGPSTMVTETGSGLTGYSRADKLVIGTTKKSFSMEKSFLDLTTKAINYRGMIVNTLAMNFSYGELATGTLGFLGNGQQIASIAGDFMTNTRTIDPPATTPTMNGSIDMPFFVTNASGAFTSGLLLQNFNINLNNNLSAQTAIGNIAPRDYSAGTAQITLELSAYLDNTSWAGVMEKKLSQEAFAAGWMVKNPGGWYGFYIPQLQVSFEDPASPGRDQDILLEMSGTAKVNVDGSSAFVIYRAKP